MKASMIVRPPMRQSRVRRSNTRDQPRAAPRIPVDTSRIKLNTVPSECRLCYLHSMGLTVQQEGTIEVRCMGIVYRPSPLPAGRIIYDWMAPVGGNCRSSRKNARRRALASASQTPAVTVNVWLSRRAPTMSNWEPHAPAFGSRQPYTRA